MVYCAWNLQTYAVGVTKLVILKNVIFAHIDYMCCIVKLNSNFNLSIDLVLSYHPPSLQPTPTGLAV